MYIERTLKNLFEKVLKIYPVVAVVGARQCGKTTFLKEELNKIGPSDFSYLSFDDPDVREIFEKDIKEFEEQFLKKGRVSILDEIHYCKDAGQKLKYLADKGHKLWITSSSEMILSKEVLSYLVGRVSILRLYPFSFKEYLLSKNQKSSLDKIMKRLVKEHILYGGYPKVVLTPDIELKKVILLDLYNTMVLKDIASTFSINDIKSLESFCKYISFNIGNVFSYGSISNALDISFQSSKKYLNALEKSHLILRISPFFRNKLKEISKQPKLYYLDTGLRNLISKDYKIDGHLFENYVASELIKGGHSLKYWRTKAKAEVDFIVEKEKDIIPIEVKLKSSGKIERSLRYFIDNYKTKKAFVVFFEGKKKKLKIGGCEVLFIPFYELLDSLK
jgi:uncharacterized protein